jgi:hypothetical protein
MIKKYAVLILLLSVILAGCGLKNQPVTNKEITSTITLTPAQKTTATWTPTAVETPGLQTPVPNTVPVVFATASDSPSMVWFVIYDAAREQIFQTGDRVTVIYLPAGDYSYQAMAPIPTQPLGCYSIEQDFGFSAEGQFTVEKQPILIEVKLGMLVLPCTSTPTP